ncbi:MAG: hypothetical protein ACI9SI_000327 [Polaribacter sp.]|jgi:hypothetical protein
MLILFNTSSVRLSANMMMAMMKLNKSHVLFFVTANIALLFFKILLIFQLKLKGTKLPQ